MTAFVRWKQESVEDSDMGTMNFAVPFAEIRFREEIMGRILREIMRVQREGFQGAEEACAGP